MSKAAPKLVGSLAKDGKIHGIISLGGGGGTAIGTAAMKALPIGFPKVMVSTLASGNTTHYVGSKDITMIPSIVDVTGLNGISKKIFTRAAGAICGMVESEVGTGRRRAPVDCGQHVREYDGVCRNRKANPRKGWIRSTRFPCHGNWRKNHGNPHRRQFVCRRPRYHDYRMGGRIMRGIFGRVYPS